MNNHIKYEINKISRISLINGDSLPIGTDAWVCVVNKSKEIFVQYFADWSSWIVPGSFLRPGETAQQAAMRGFKEATGVEVQLADVAPFAYIDYTMPHYKGTALFFVAHEWTGELTNGTWLSSDREDISKLLRPVFYAINLGCELGIRRTVEMK